MTDQTATTVLDSPPDAARLDPERLSEADRLTADEHWLAEHGQLEGEQPMNTDHALCANHLYEAIHDALSGRSAAVELYDPIRTNPNDLRYRVIPDVLVFVDEIPEDTTYLRTWSDDWVPPALVIELISKSTAVRDQSSKAEIYAEMGVREYLIFDPYARDSERQVLTVPLLAFRLNDEGKYDLIPIRENRFPSEVLDLHFEPRPPMLRLYDPTTGSLIPTRAERAAKEAERAEKESERAEAAESEVKRLREELERLRKEAGEDT